MREAKFRAWHKENNYFIYATIKDIWKNGWHCCEATRHPPNCNGDFLNGVETTQDRIFTTEECLEKQAKDSFSASAEWEEYIGRKDKNNKEIYENDIVLVNHPEDKTGDFTNSKQRVFFYEDGFCHGNGDRPPKRMWQYCEVIGNRFENSKSGENNANKKLS